VHGHATAPRHEAHDLVARDGRAAARQAHHDVVEPLDVHARGALALRTGRARRALDGDRELLLAPAQLTLHPLRDGSARHVALADRRKQRGEVGVVHLLGDRDERIRLRDALDRQPFLPEGLGELVAPGLDRVDAPLTGEPLPDLRAGARRVHELEPVAARARARHLAREDLDGVAGVERAVERHQPTVDARADAAVPDLGVDRVREVDRCRARGQGDDLALRREDEDLTLLEVDLERRQELTRVVGVLLPVDHALEPREVFFT
jgi:hypothetical protein